MSSLNKAKLYSDLLAAYSKAHSDNKSKKSIQENVKRDKDVKNLVDIEIAKLSQIKAKKQLAFQKFWLDSNESQNVSAPSVDKENSSNSANILTIDSSSVEDVREEDHKKYSTPAQDKLKREILLLDSDVAALNNRVDCGLINI